MSRGVFDNRKPVTDLMLLRRRKAIFRLFCKKSPSIQMIKEYDAEDFFDDGKSLQHFVIDNLKPHFNYATGIDIIDAAYNIAVSQINNGGEVLMRKGVEVDL